MNKIYDAVQKNEKYGYWELAPEYRKPMHDFYKDEYYQEDHALYTRNEYDELDLSHKRHFYEAKLSVIGKWGGV